MKEQNKHRSLNEIFEEIKTNISHESSANMKSLIDEMDVELAKARKKSLYYKNIVSLIIVLLFLSVASMLFLIDRNTALDSRVQTLEYRDSLFSKVLKSDTKSIVTYRIKNGKPITYNQLANENDSIRIRLNMVTSHYPISFIQKGSQYSIHAPQVDSAMMLLPVYRDMLKYDKKSNSWIVTRNHYFFDNE